MHQMRKLPASYLFASRPKMSISVAAKSVRRDLYDQIVWNGWYGANWAKGATDRFGSQGAEVWQPPISPLIMIATCEFS